MESVRPVIELPEERQISWVGRRIYNIVEILTRDKRYATSRAAGAARDELASYAEAGTATS
jgi:hypothetical protein